MQKSIYTEPQLKLCAWLRARREEKGLKTRELAALLDVDHSKVVRVEGGSRRLDVVQFVTWCVELGANPHDIVEQLLTLETGGNNAVGTPTWETDKAAAEPKPVTYAPRRKAKPGA